VTKIHGKLEIRSKVNGGTEIELIVPGRVAYDESLSKSDRQTGTPPERPNNSVGRRERISVLTVNDHGSLQRWPEVTTIDPRERSRGGRQRCHGWRGHRVSGYLNDDAAVFAGREDV
jgi:hypothetical protein